MYREITKCRVCGNSALATLVDLGEMALTGVFPKAPHAAVTRGPLQLVRCDPAASPGACGLVQLRQSYDVGEMYGENYGYRSSLNRAMVRHLTGISERMQQLVPLGQGDIVVDIGSNDGTLLSCYPPGPTLVGIDPTSAKFGRYYRADVQTIPEFFSAEVFRAHFGDRKAKVVTSIAMFYDLEHPLSFVEDVRDILADDGVWCLEQSYLPTMLRQNSYDTICHEHLEYYSLKQIGFLLSRAGLEIKDVHLSDANGGSFAVMAGRPGKATLPAREAVARLIEAEAALALDGPDAYEGFRRRIEGTRSALLGLLDRIRSAGGRVVGYGASTKGNVILQYCGIGPERIPCIAEVNEDKFGSYTPGTLIPIVPEAEARKERPDYFLVLPWHFREGLVRKERRFLEAGGRMIFPLPEVEVVSL